MTREHGIAFLRVYISCFILLVAIFVSLGAVRWVLSALSWWRLCDVCSQPAFSEDYVLFFLEARANFHVIDESQRILSPVLHYF